MIDIVLKSALIILALILIYKSHGDNVKQYYWVLVSIYWLFNLLLSLKAIAGCD